MFYSRQWLSSTYDMFYDSIIDLFTESLHFDVFKLFSKYVKRTLFSIPLVVICLVFFLNDAPLRTTSHIFFVRSYTCIGYTSTSELQTMHSLWHTADINDDPSCKPHKFVCMVKIQLIYRPLPKITEPQNIFFLKNQNRTTIP